MKKKLIKWGLPLLAAVIAALLLEVIQIRTQPVSSVPVLSEEAETEAASLYPDRFLAQSGYELTETGMIVTDGDPQLYFSTNGISEISSISFHMSRLTESPIAIQVFYLKELDYTEQDSVKVTCPAGVDFWTVEIPTAHYSQIRIDMDGEPIPVVGIDASSVQPKREIQPAAMHPRRIILVAVLLYALLLWLRWFKTPEKLKNALLGGWRNLREGGVKSALKALLIPAGAGAGAFLYWLFRSVFAGQATTGPGFVFACVAGVFAASLFVFRETLKTQPEYLFLILMLCVGFLYSYYVPHTGLNGWDEDYHYRQALHTSYIDAEVLTPQDEITIARTTPASFDLSGGLQELHDHQDELFRSNQAQEYRGFVMPTAWEEFFNGMGLFVGRALGLRYYMIHFLGRFFGLMAYAFAGFLAIRKLKSGKMIAAVTLLIPTAVYIACSYNYDSYLTGFTALGLCCYVAQWQDRTAKITLRDTVLMMACLAFGCLAKPVYFPLLWIPILLPRDKFTDRRHHVLYVLSMVAVTGLLVLSYMAPTLLYGGGGDISYTDSRGAGAVSLTGQLEYILANPLAYIRMVWNYITGEYFNLNRLGEFMTNFAYHGIMPNQYIYLVLLLTAAFTDKNEHDLELVHHPWAHLWPVLTSLGLIVMVITSMYLSFTPVGAARVDGAQFRYLIPMVLPVLLHCGSGKVQNKMDRSWYHGLMLAAAAAVNFACVYNAFICRYF